MVDGVSTERGGGLAQQVPESMITTSPALSAGMRTQNSQHDARQT